MAGHFDNLEVLEPRVFEQGGDDGGEGEGDEVVVKSRLRLTLKNGGGVWERGMVQVVRVERAEGRIVEITPFYWDVRGLRGVLGLEG